MVTFGARPKLMVTAGNWPWWLTTSGCKPRSILVTAGERHLRAVGAGHVDAGEVGRVALVLRIDLEDDAILVALGVERRDLPLREGVVERVVDVLDAHAEPRGRDAVDHRR